MDASSHTIAAIRRSVVCIKNSQDVVLGTGILVSRTHIVTCAHVLAGADSQPAVKCVFFGRERDPRNVTDIVRPKQIAGYAMDVAVLRIEAPFDVGEEPLSWADPPAARGEVFFAGFRQGVENTSNPEIVQTHIGFYEASRGCYMLQDGCTQGFSGGPVLCNTEHGVTIIGLVIANLRDSPHRTWFLPFRAIEQSVGSLAVADLHFPPPKAGGATAADLMSQYASYLDGLRRRNDLDKAFIDLTAEQLLPARLKVDSVVSTIVAEVTEVRSPQLRAFVLGNYGSGKSCVAIESAARALAHYRQHHPEARGRLPIYLQLRDWKKLPSWFELARHLAESGHFPFASVGEVFTLAERDELIFLLDGIDEISASFSGSGSIALVNEIPRSLYDHASFIAFSRLSFFLKHDQVFELFDEEDNSLPPDLASGLAASRYWTLSMAAPSEAQINQYLRDVCGADAEFAVEVLEEIYDLADLAKRPVLLRMMVDCIQGLREVRDRSGQFRPGDLYEIYITRWLQHEMHRSHFSLNRRREIIENLALTMWKGRSLRISHGQLRAFLQAQLDQEDPDPFIFDIGNCSFLDLLSEGYEFSHKSFLEYFVAGAIVRDLFHARRGDDADVFLLSSCLASTAPQNEVVDFVQSQVVRRVTTDPASVQALINALRSPWPQDRGRIAHLLGYVAVELSDPRISEPLSKAFYLERDPWAKRSIAIACGRAGNNAIMEHYVQTLLPQQIYRFENLKFHIEHYGNIGRVITALVSHILSDRYRFLRGVDLFTLRQIINCEKPITREEREFVQTILSGLRDTTDEADLTAAALRLGPDLLKTIPPWGYQTVTTTEDIFSPINYEDITELFDRVHSLKTLKRQGWINHNIKDPESVADHSYGVAILALLFARRLGLNVGTAVTMALLHDLSESIVGDIIPSDGVDPADKAEAEERATQQILHKFDADGELIELWRDFQYGRTPEGVLVKELDRLEMAFQADRYERHNGLRLDEFFSYVEARLQSSDLVKMFEAMVRSRNRGVAD